MILVDLRTPFKQVHNASYDWHEDQQIGEMPTWIKSAKEQIGFTNEHYEIVDKYFQ